MVEPGFDLPIELDNSESALRSLKREENRITTANSNSRSLRGLGMGVAAVSSAVALGNLNFPEYSTALLNAVAYGAVSTGSLATVGKSVVNSRDRNQELEEVQKPISNTYVFGQQKDLSGLLEKSEEVQFRDFYFDEKEQHNMYDFNDNPSVGLYEAVMSEPGDINQMLTVDDESNSYLLDIELSNSSTEGKELAARFVGEAQDIEAYLEGGTSGEEFTV
jgi:hypothetical protein